MPRSLLEVVVERADVAAIFPVLTVGAVLQ
jgi:hypothetical protein